MYFSDTHFIIDFAPAYAVSWVHLYSSFQHKWEQLDDRWKHRNDQGHSKIIFPIMTKDENKHVEQSE